MLFTVLLVSLILTIALGISNLTLRQNILSNLTKDSGVAFYQADAAVECGMYYEYLGLFPYGIQPSNAEPSIDCAGTSLVRDDTASYTNFIRYVFASPDPTASCYTVVFDKTHAYDAPPNKYSRVLGTGKNICGQNPRQVERALEVRFK